MIPVSDFIRWREEIAPPSLVCAGDNIGLQTGNPRKEVKCTLVTLDLTPEVIKEAYNKNCQLIITHHPLIRSPLRSLSGDETFSVLREVIRQGLIVYAAHTNLDVAAGGTNDLLAETLGLKKTFRRENQSADKKRLWPNFGGVGGSWRYIKKCARSCKYS